MKIHSECDVLLFLALYARIMPQQDFWKILLLKLPGRRKNARWQKHDAICLKYLFNVVYKLHKLHWWPSLGMWSCTEVASSLPRGRGSGGVKRELPRNRGYLPVCQHWGWNSLIP